MFECSWVKPATSLGPDTVHYMLDDVPGSMHRLDSVAFDGHTRPQVPDTVLCYAAFAFLLMFTAPFIFGMAAVHTAAGYIMGRFLIGWALAGFVTCQFWTSIMFSPNVVGFANALAGGWGNAGQTLTPTDAHILT